MLPAVGQGALGIELRKDDAELLAGLAFLNDAGTTVAVDRNWEPGWPTSFSKRAAEIFLLRYTARHESRSEGKYPG
jgi:hypothetical protein